MQRLKVSSGEFPWAAAILRGVGNGHFVPTCGGALIDEQWVVTTAHCDVSPRDLVVVGFADLAGTKRHTVRIEEVRTHERFDPSSLACDIALLRLASPRAGVPLLLIDDGKRGIVLEGKACIVGWGADKPGGTFSRTLRRLDVELPSSGAVSTGDSGSPLLVRDPGSGNWIAGGLVSDGVRRGAPGHGHHAHGAAFDRYTRLADFDEWIRETVQPRKPLRGLGPYTGREATNRERRVES